MVDNSSTDGSNEALRAAFPQVRLLEMGKTSAFPRPLRLASEATHGASGFFYPSTTMRPSLRMQVSLMLAIGV